MVIALVVPFFDYIKPDRSECFKFCVAACNNREHRLFMVAPNIKRIMLHMLIEVGVIESMGLYVRDMTKVFVRPKTNLRKRIYMAQPK